MEGKAGTKHARRYKWVTIGSRPFDFLGVAYGGPGKGDFRNEYHFLKTDSEEENSCKEIPGEKKSHTEKKNLSLRIMLEKILHRCMLGKNYITRGLGKKRILTQTKSPILPPPPESNGRPLMEILLHNERSC